MNIKLTNFQTIQNNLEKIENLKNKYFSLRYFFFDSNQHCSEKVTEGKWH